MDYLIDTQVRVFHGLFQQTKARLQFEQIIRTTAPIDLFGRIIRQDSGFENTGRPRTSGGSYSIGEFLDSTGKLWIGKVDNRRPDPAEMEGRSCEEKIAYTFYEYYGVIVPQTILSLHPSPQTGIPEDAGISAVHILSEKLEGYH